MDEIKKGARNSRKDQERLQSMHDYSVENGAMCEYPKSVGEDGFVSFGDEVKATRMDNGGVKLVGYLIRFSDEASPDLTGDYFTKNTDFGDAVRSDGWFNHRLPVEHKGRRVTYKDQLPDVTLTKDEIGIFAEIVLGARYEYEKMIAELGLAKALGWSSGTAPHLVDRKQVGNASEITRWKLGLDASLTPTPAEYRNGVVPIKSLITHEAAMPDKAEQNQETQETQSTKELPMNEEDRKAFLAEVKTALTEGQDAFKEEVKAVAKDAAQEVIANLPEIKTAMNIQVTHDPADDAFKSIAENLMAIRAEKVTPNKADNDFPRLRYLKATGASEGVPQDGGILLDPTLSAEIIKPIHEDGPFSADARKLPVSGNSNYGWINGVDETSRVAGSRWGGIRGYRIAEAVTKTASKPTFRRINWELKEYAAVVVATDQLLADASMFSEIVRLGVTEELKFMLNEDIFNGSGLAGPQGFMNSGALITVTRTTGSKILGEDISAMYNRMDLRGRKSAKWYIGNDSSPQLDNLFAVGSTAVLYPYASIGVDGVKRLYGRPIEVTEFNESLNTSGDIAFADMSQYLMWEKGGIEQANSIHVYFLSDETAFRFVYRVDGKSSCNTALTPLKGSTTTSPYVVLGSAT
jgi:HK97 family phage major capsid protein